MARQRIQFGPDVGPELYEKLRAIVDSRNEDRALEAALFQQCHPNLSIKVAKKLTVPELVVELINREYADMKRKKEG
jgi:hypothetical protein